MSLFQFISKPYETQLIALTWGNSNTCKLFCVTKFVCNSLWRFWIISFSMAERDQSILSFWFCFIVWFGWEIVEEGLLMFSPLRGGKSLGGSCILWLLFCQRDMAEKYNFNFILVRLWKKTLSNNGWADLLWSFQTSFVSKHCLLTFRRWSRRGRITCLSLELVEFMLLVQRPICLKSFFYFLFPQRVIFAEALSSARILGVISVPKINTLFSLC